MNCTYSANKISFSVDIFDLIIFMDNCLCSNKNEIIFGLNLFNF